MKRNEKKIQKYNTTIELDRRDREERVMKSMNNYVDEYGDELLDRIIPIPSGRKRPRSAGRGNNETLYHSPSQNNNLQTEGFERRNNSFENSHIRRKKNSKHLNEELELWETGIDDLDDEESNKVINDQTQFLNDIKNFTKQSISVLGNSIL